MFGFNSERRKLISQLEEFVYMAEKGTPLGDNFPKFSSYDRIGRLLNRLVDVYKRGAIDWDSLSVAREQVVKESQDNIRQKKQLTQNINHELKTPVSSINGYLETILNNPNLDREQVNLFLQKCYEQSQRLSNLLLDLSTITRLDEAGSIIEMEDLSLSHVVAEVVFDMMPVEPPKDSGKVLIVNNLPDGLEMRGNSSLLYSVFHNLLENALFYSKGTQVAINLLRKDDKEYEISVADDGVGIDNIHLARIFERFYRIDKGRSRKLGGTGLGLSIVKNAVNLHGGTIKALPVEPHGLEFRFTLSINPDSSSK